MPSNRSTAIALHVEAAKRLLRELEMHADSAMSALGRENGSEFFAAVDERNKILGKLDDVVEALTHERATAGATGGHDAEAGALLNEMARAAASALESHEQLLMRTRYERDRLADALQKTKRADSVANRYAATASANRTRTLSVTG